MTSSSCQLLNVAAEGLVRTDTKCHTALFLCEFFRLRGNHGSQIPREIMYNVNNYNNVNENIFNTTLLEKETKKGQTRKIERKEKKKKKRNHL